MKLFLIDKPGCHHMSELIPGISAVYQLEQEFHPYLIVDFIPNRKYPPGIILVAGNEKIRKNYTFDDPNDIVEVRKLIWKYINKYHKPTNIADDNGCIKDFRKTQTNRVIQGWKNKWKSAKEEPWCTVVKNMAVKHFIKHELYRLKNVDEQDMNICKKVRADECINNYARNTPSFRRCIDEVNYLCNHGYPENKKANIVLEYRETLKNQILQYLKKNNMKVNKKVLDVILSNGFFELVQNRAGNKATEYNNVIHVINDIDNEYNYFSRLIEGYNEDNDPYILVLPIIVIIVIALYFVLKI